MLKGIAFAGCVLVGAGCLIADDVVSVDRSPVGGEMMNGVANAATPSNHIQSRQDFGAAEVLWKNGDVKYEGIQLSDGELIPPAGLLFDNGADNYTNGFEITNWRMAEDFVLRNESLVDHVDFSVLDTNQGSNLGNWEGTADWQILADAGGAPGAVMASGSGTNITTTFDQNTNNWDFWDFGMDLDTPQCLPAGTYWLALHLNKACDVVAALYWGVTDDNGSPNHNHDTNCSGTFTGSTFELSFSLSGTVGCGGGDTCVDFEAAGPCVFNSTNPLRTLYSGLGINFTGPNREDGGAILDECGGFGITARSGTNFLAFNRAHNGGVQMLNGGFPEDPETVSLASPASRVSVYVSGGAFDAKFQMDAFDGSGNFLGSNAVASTVGVWSELAVSAAGIRRVVVTEVSGAAFFVWDDLCVTFGSQDCLNLRVDRLIAGQRADWNVSGALPREQVAIVYGFAPGTTAVNGFAGYCATFGIQGVNQSKVICTKTADAGGNVNCSKPIPDGVRGRRVLSQAAQRNTCPEECVSNLDDQVVG